MNLPLMGRRPVRSRPVSRPLMTCRLRTGRNLPGSSLNRLRVRAEDQGWKRGRRGLPTSGLTCPTALPVTTLSPHARLLGFCLRSDGAGVSAVVLASGRVSDCRVGDFSPALSAREGLWTTKPCPRPMTGRWAANW